MYLLRKMTTLVVIAISAASVSATLSTDQPFMQAALSDLREAMTHLRNATANKGGHRQRAMDFTNGAINTVNKGIEYDRNNISPHRRNSTGFELATASSADQPNMEKARTALQNAMANLRKASDDKGGYKKQAIAMTTNAINSVNSGIQYDRSH